MRSRRSTGDPGDTGGTDDATGRAAKGYRTLTDEDVVAGVRRGDEAALEEFLFRFQRVVLGQARRFGVPAAERGSWVQSVLGEVAMSLRRPDAKAPRSILAYLVSAAHHRFVDEYRSEAKQRTLEDWAAGVPREPEDVARLGGLSEYSMRCSRGVDREPAPLSPFLARLSSATMEQLTPEERRIVSGLECGETHQEIALALGISRAAAAQRICRIRKRLHEAALLYGFRMTLDERVQLLRFLRRTEAYDDEELARLRASR